jgi:DNA-binding MarR family transcriptional regulator
MSQQEKQMLLDFFKALADENRLTLIGLLNQQEYNVGQLAEMLKLKEPTVSHHLAKLREVGLVNLRSIGNQRRYILNDYTLKQWKNMVMNVENINQEADRSQPSTAWIDDLPLDEYDKKVIKDYTDYRRLKHIPVQQKKLQSVLRWIIMEFKPGVTYTEREVNAIITQYHEDYARLRRELIDFGYLRRERGGSKYWLTPENEIV